jgi:dienelactone hydrolase
VTTRNNIFWRWLVILLFFGALFWAKEQDPFSRKWFTVKASDNASFKCVAVLPKPIRQCPVIIYAHGSGEDLMLDGYGLRQMAELGLAVVSLEYSKTNAATFSQQFEALLHCVKRQSWTDTNAIVWLGFGQGAINTFVFALQQPEEQPRLLVQLSGAGLSEGQTNNRLQSWHCPILLVHGELDETFPVADTKRFASVLESYGKTVELKIVPGMSYGMESDRGVIFRCIGEYCLTHLAGRDAWRNYHSIAQWQAEAPALWLFWLPAAAWIAGWFAWWRHSRPASPENIKLSRAEVALRWVAAILAAWALTETALHLIPPHFFVSTTTLSIARRSLVQPKERADFEYLAAQPIWQDQKLKTLLDHVELAGYNRELINWHLDDKIYRDFVLSPVIIGNSSEQLDWRRPLWEEFYPRIRYESSPEGAARIVVRHLRERVTIAALPNLPHDVPAIWLRQITGQAGFEIIYVAALRSVGVPARLNSNKQPEFYDGGKWQFAPQPVLSSYHEL